MIAILIALVIAAVLIGVGWFLWTKLPKTSAEPEAPQERNEKGEPVFEVGDIVWQRAHAPDGYRFEVVGSRLGRKEQTVMLCRPVRDADGQEVRAFAPPRDPSAYILVAGDLDFVPGGTIGVELPVLEIRASALAIAKD